mgnify:CR=1 FL=1
MLAELDYVFFCRKCRRLRRVYEGHRETLVLPEQKPEFDIVTWCCVICKEPVVEVTTLSQRGKADA